jgi:alpha-ketoglutarate-dependent sulfate ester dioxygenase
MTPGRTNIAAKPVAGHIGAEITGVALGSDLDQDTVDAIRETVLTHRVVFFRDQHHLDDNSQAGFGQLLGELTTAHPTVPGLAAERNVLPVDSENGNRANSWHSDVTFVDRPPSFSILRAIRLPAYGGDTAWANTVSAYEGLPEVLRQLADNLWALHTNDYDYASSHGSAQLSEKTRKYREVFTSTIYQTEHPVVRIHPETGERALLLGHFAQRIIGLNGRDSRHLLDVLQGHVTRLENTVRWRWREGDVALWDNRTTQHYAVADYGDLARRMHRITIAGDVPISIGGKQSVARQGDSADYAPAVAT